MHITVFEGLTSRDSHAIYNSRVVFEQLNSRGGICMGLCMPIEVLLLYGRIRRSDVQHTETRI